MTAAVGQRSEYSLSTQSSLAFVQEACMWSGTRTAAGSLLPDTSTDKGQTVGSRVDREEGTGHSHWQFSQTGIIFMAALMRSRSESTA